MSCKDNPEYESDDHPDNYGVRCECGRWKLRNMHEYKFIIWECPKDKELMTKEWAKAYS
jgi:hypothetical protein